MCLLLRSYQKSAIESAITWGRYKTDPAIIVLPTGSGKSHVIAALAEHYSQLGERVCILAHRKELLVQNGGKMNISHGYCSASLGDKDLHLPVIVGGIQTIARREFEKFSTIIIDECHRLPDNEEMGQYWQFIAKHQPCKVFGLTATPYRLKGGKLSWGEYVYEMDYGTLQKSGYLAPIINKLKHTPDLSDIKLIANDYKEDELSSVMEDPELVDAAMKNIIAYGATRRAVIIFCVSVRHATIIYNALIDNGLSAALIHGGTPDSERDQMIEAFRTGKTKHLVNVAVLLEGFDAPIIDMIVCLRPTKSKALWEQLLGRGVRLSEGKENCLLIDMSGNLREHGGIGTAIKAPAKGKEQKRENGRICPNCESWAQPANAKQCADCGYEFLKADPHKVAHDYEPDTSDNIKKSAVAEYDVTGVTYNEHYNRKKGTKSIRVDYYTPYGKVSEWIAPHSESGWAKKKAWEWFKERGKEIYTTPEADISAYSLDDLLFYCADLKTPVRIIVDESEKFPRILRCEYANKEKPGSSDTARINTVDELIGGDEIVF